MMLHIKNRNILKIHKIWIKCNLLNFYLENLFVMLFQFSYFDLGDLFLFKLYISTLFLLIFEYEWLRFVVDGPDFAGGELNLCEYLI